LNKKQQLYRNEIYLPLTTISPPSTQYKSTQINVKVLRARSQVGAIGNGHRISRSLSNLQTLSRPAVDHGAGGGDDAACADRKQIVAR
jgi:hypothetical protein